MKFVYFGYDFLLDTVHRLMQEGHEIAGIYSFPCDNIFNFNSKTTALAKQLDIPFTIQKPMDMDINAFIGQGVEVFFSGGYLYKIPPVDEEHAYAVNFHPSLLPKGRGMMPSPTIIMEQPQTAGFTLHKMTQDFDAGDILMQKPIAIGLNDDIETYCAKLVMQAPDAVSKLFSNLDHYWKIAAEQDEVMASKFPAPDEAMRTLDWNTSNDALERKGRAFGRFGCLARFNGELWAVYNFKCWREEHTLKPGTVAATLSREIVIATQEGFAVLKEIQKIH